MFVHVQCRKRAYTTAMKTTISIPCGLFSSADSLARRLGISRSELFLRAVSEFLERSKGSEVTKRLNEIYATEDSLLDPAFAELQYHTLAEQCRTGRR